VRISLQLDWPHVLGALGVLALGVIAAGVVLLVCNGVSVLLYLWETRRDGRGRRR
jgi:hypothetical protein